MEAGITAIDIKGAHYMLINRTVECQKWSNVEEIGKEAILVSEFVRSPISVAFGKFNGLSDRDHYLDKD